VRQLRVCAWCGGCTSHAWSRGCARGLAAAQALAAASTDVGLLHSSLPELSVRDKASELVEKAVR
jgi:hypothetical protein